MPPAESSSIHIGADATSSILVTGSQNLILQAEQVLIRATETARQQGRDPAYMLRILAVLAAPVHDPDQPNNPPSSLDLKQEWHELAQTIRESHAPILLVRVVPPTLDSLRRALSPRAQAQALFPHILHFSGHAWKGGLLLEDEFGQVHRVPTDEILAALRGLPQPMDLVVLNGCETAAEARSVAQAIVEAGLARAAIGHTRPVDDPEAIRFAARLYTELADGFPLREAVARALKVTGTSGGARHLKAEVALLGDGDLRFERFTGGEPWIDDRLPRGYLPSRLGFFLGRGPQLVEIARALAHPPAIILLSGPAAIGKTSLALEAAHRNAYRFPGGVAFAQGPSPEEDRPAAADDLLLQLAAGLGIQATPTDVAEKLAEHTRLTPTLLILDNVEGLPPAERARLRDRLRHLGEESAAILLSRPPQQTLESLPCARSLPLHEGIGTAKATRYALLLAREKRIPLQPDQAQEIARAADGHPRLVELLVAQARRRDLAALLREVRKRRGDFQKQLDLLYDQSARLLEERGRLDAWKALLLFPGNVAPEALLYATAGAEGADALRDAALADFDPALQAWRWHGTVAEYAHAHWPLRDDERRARLEALLPVWTAWLKDLPPKTPETASRLEVQQTNLTAVLGEANHLPDEPLRALLRALHRTLPDPDRTLALRPFEEMVYRAWAGLATEEEEQAQAFGMLGYALSALGRHEEALEASQEAVKIRRQLAQANPQAFLPELATSLNNLGAMLSNLGRHEEALEASQKAVTYYRQLAHANPQAFLPDLARSLNNLGERLSEVDRPKEALRAYEEAMRTLAPFFFALPAAFRSRMSYMLDDYLQACEKVGEEPDEELVRQIRETLQAADNG